MLLGGLARGIGVAGRGRGFIGDDPGPRLILHTNSDVM